MNVERPINVVNTDSVKPCPAIIVVNINEQIWTACVELIPSDSILFLSDYTADNQALDRCCRFREYMPFSIDSS